MACDLDGTLLDPSGFIRPAVRAAIHEIRRAGIHVVLATGRSVWDTAPAAGVLGLDGPQLVMNGGALMWPIDERIAWANRMRAGLALEALWFAREVGIAPLFGFPHGHASECPLGVAPIVPEFARTARLNVVRRLEDVASEGPVRIYLPTSPDEHAQILGAAEWWFGDDASVVWGDRNGLEVMNPGSNKGSALQRYAETLGIDRCAVAAIGDGPNDREMLAFADRSAVLAAANSAGPSPDVAISPRMLVVPSSADDGVAHAIRAWWPSLAERGRELEAVIG